MSRLAIYEEFPRAYSKLPRSQQRRFRELNRQLQTEEAASRLDFEQPGGLRDGNVMLLPLGKDYRVVVLRPSDEGTMVMLWADRQEQAIDWARERFFTVNPLQGTLQVFDLQRLSTHLGYTFPARGGLDKGKPRKGSRAAASSDSYSSLFVDIGDDRLLAAGVPRVLLPAVRAVRTDRELQELGPHLPEECHEALSRMLLGDPPEARREESETVDPEDFEAAIKHPDSRRRFTVIQSAEELEWILAAPLQRWRVFLHPSQERLVEGRFEGPVRVLGGAGTGKTVVAMHRARYLARARHRDPADRILLTTFTANLSQNMRDLMDGLCGDERSRIDVVHLHLWVRRYLDSSGMERRIASEDEVRASWKQALERAGTEGRELGFYQHQWRDVIWGQDVHTLEDYLQAASPKGRSPLAPKEREACWAVFQEFRQALADRGCVEWAQACRDVRIHLSTRSGERPYRSVVVDEAQDLSAEALRLVRALAPEGPDDLFIVGDAHQRIYDHRVKLSRVGIDIGDRRFKLRLNYRTTEQIRDWAVDLLEGCGIDDLDGEPDDQRGYVSLLHGSDPDVRVFPDIAAEQQYLIEALKDLSGRMPLENICLVARTHSALRERYEPSIRKSGFACVVLDQQSEREAGPGVRLATMHRVKGLEFSCVIIAGLDGETFPHRGSGSSAGEAIDRAEHDTAERCLLYVASTRARERLILTAGGMPGEAVKRRRGPSTGSG